MFGRATDTGGNIEGLHDQHDSPAALLVDECKSIRPDRGPSAICYFESVFLDIPGAVCG